MKIKVVCERTGLTDRTVRYYIEEKLISPAYTENYLGRKTFDFSEIEIQTLNDIAILRKFGFTIVEIREMLLHPEEIIRIAKELQCRKQIIIDGEQKFLLALSRLNADQPYTVNKLAACLSAPVVEAPLPTEDIKFCFAKSFLHFLKSLFIWLATWLPLLFSLLSLIDRLQYYSFPKIEPLFIALTIPSLIPSFFILVLPMIKAHFKWKPIAKRILTVLCILSIPVSSFMSFGIISHSETTDFNNYRDLDPVCLANRSTLYQALFPKWPKYFDNEVQPDGSLKTVYLDAHYYYQYSLGWDYTYDIYAEWPLKKEEFDTEVARVKALYEEYAPPKEDNYCHYLTMQKGKYTCLIIYNGNTPFEKATNSYTYCIFAYDEINLKVRYIYCDSLDDGADQPYYLSLDW